MTGLEIFLSIVLWVIVGLWISWKRTWYKDHEDLNVENLVTASIIFNCVFMPIALIWSIFTEYANSDWNQKGK